MLEQQQPHLVDRCDIDNSWCWPWSRNLSSALCTVRIFHVHQCFKKKTVLLSMYNVNSDLCKVYLLLLNMVTLCTVVCFLRIYSHSGKPAQDGTTSGLPSDRSPSSAQTFKGFLQPPRFMTLVGWGESQPLLHWNASPLLCCEEGVTT